MQTEFQFKLSWKRGLSVLLLTLFSFSLAVAQVLVRGTVIDQTGESVPGASIQVKGGTQGTISDLDGKFSLNVPNKKSVLVISFIGYTTQELPVDVSKPMSVVLKEYKNVGRSRCRWLSGGQEERPDRCCGKGKYGRFA